MRHLFLSLILAFFPLYAAPRLQPRETSVLPEILSGMASLLFGWRLWMVFSASRPELLMYLLLAVVVGIPLFYLLGLLLWWGRYVEEHGRDGQPTHNARALMPGNRAAMADWMVQQNLLGSCVLGSSVFLVALSFLLPYILHRPPLPLLLALLTLFWTVEIWSQTLSSGLRIAVSRARVILFVIVMTVCIGTGIGLVLVFPPLRDPWEGRSLPAQSCLPVPFSKDCCGV